MYMVTVTFMCKSPEAAELLGKKLQPLATGDVSMLPVGKAEGDEPALYGKQNVLATAFYRVPRKAAEQFSFAFEKKV